MKKQPEPERTRKRKEYETRLGGVEIKRGKLDNPGPTTSCFRAGLVQIGARIKLAAAGKKGRTGGAFILRGEEKRGTPKGGPSSVRMAEKVCSRGTGCHKLATA